MKHTLECAHGMNTVPAKTDTIFGPKAGPTDPKPVRGSPSSLSIYMIPEESSVQA